MLLRTRRICSWSAFVKITLHRCLYITHSHISNSDKQRFWRKQVLKNNSKLQSKCFYRPFFVNEITVSWGRLAYTTAASTCEIVTGIQIEEQDNPTFKADSREPHLIHQTKLNHLVQDLMLLENELSF